jgi:RecB family exonuclease
MTTKRSSKKTRAILKAIAEGNSIEQILGRYSTLNYHDIFRAAAQAPVSHRRHEWARVTKAGWLECAWAGKDGRLAPQTVFHAWSD